MSSSLKIKHQLITALCATLGGMAVGTVLGYSSPAGVILTNNATDFNIYLSGDQNSWFSSSSNLGAMIGGPVAGLCINYVGRRGTMIYSIIPILIGWILIIAAQNFAMLLSGRIITGFSTGMICLSVPTYLGEISSPHIRGMLGSSFQLMLSLGIMFSYCMGAAFESFRWIAGVCAIIPCIHSLLMIFSKESPSYLLSKDKDNEAEESLKHFRGKNYTELSTELEEMKDSLEQSRQRKMSLQQLNSPHILRPLFIALGLMVFQQFCGINAVTFNLALIFEEAGSDMSITLSSIIVGLVQVLGTLGGAVLSDKAGRKIMLSISAIMMAISLATLGAFFYIKEYNIDRANSLGWLPLVSLIVFIIAFSLGFGPIPWTMMGELFSPEAKEIAGSLAIMTNWGSAFIVTLIFAPLQGALHDYGAYWLFSGICVLALVFVVTCVYETKGKTFQEIVNHFGGNQEPISTEEKI